MWCSVSITCEPGYEDVVSTCIFESGFSGLQETTDNGSVVLSAFYCRSSGDPDPLELLRQTLEETERRTGKKTAEIRSVEDVPDEDWEASWREGLGPVEIGSRLVVRPSWIVYDNSDERVEVVIDPKMAFGTGSHETTRLCLEILEKTPLRYKSLLDAGCGSGVLSIAAVKLSARCAIGFDIDPCAIDNAVENIRSNRVHDYVTVYRADLNDIEPGRFDIVIANIMSEILTPTLERFHNFVLPGGKIVFSGLLAEEEKTFVSRLKHAGFGVISINRMGEWIAIEAEEVG